MWSGKTRSSSGRYNIFGKESELHKNLRKLIKEERISLDDAWIVDAAWKLDNVHERCEVLIANRVVPEGVNQGDVQKIIPLLNDCAVLGLCRNLFASADGDKSTQVASLIQAYDRVRANTLKYKNLAVDAFLSQQEDEDEVMQQEKSDSRTQPTLAMNLLRISNEQIPASINHTRAMTERYEPGKLGHDNVCRILTSFLLTDCALSGIENGLIQLDDLKMPVVCYALYCDYLTVDNRLLSALSLGLNIEMAAKVSVAVGGGKLWQRYLEGVGSGELGTKQNDVGAIVSDLLQRSESGSGNGSRQCVMM